MRVGQLIAALGALVALAGGGQQASAQETLKVAIPQRGAWDAGVAELGLRGGIFKKHGLNLEILYTQAGPESIQALVGGSIDIATASGVSAAVGTFARGAPVRIIGSEMIGSPDLYWYVPASSPIKKVELIQERSDLTVELATMGTKVDLSGLEKGFVKSAKTYSERKGITYSTWREVGVPADVLKRAGITRGA